MIYKRQTHFHVRVKTTRNVCYVGAYVSDHLLLLQERCTSILLSVTYLNAACVHTACVYMTCFQRVCVHMGYNHGHPWRAGRGSFGECTWLVIPSLNQQAAGSSAVVMAAVCCCRGICQLTGREVRRCTLCSIELTACSLALSVLAVGGVLCVGVAVIFEHAAACMHVHALCRDMMDAADSHACRCGG